jgi:hypothetical protein
MNFDTCINDTKYLCLKKLGGFVPETVSWVNFQSGKYFKIKQNLNWGSDV